MVNTVMRLKSKEVGMKNLYVALWCCLLVFKLEAAEPVVLSEAQLRAKVAEVS